MKFTMSSAGVLASALISLISLITQNAYASQPMHGQEKPIDSGVQATSTSQRPPAVLKQPTDETMAVAAAVRQDQDPHLNGSVTDIREILPPTR